MRSPEGFVMLRSTPFFLTALATALVVGVSLAAPPKNVLPKTPAASPTGASPDFNREVRPILANHCLKCHGMDDKQRQAGLRLDNFANATGKLASGKRAIVPGKPNESELVTRILATD